jgi:subtilisin-like proprotein convertase family protein
MKNNYQKVLLACLTIIIVASTSAQNKSVNYWTISSKNAVKNVTKINRNVYPTTFQIYQLDLNSFKTALIGAPLRGESTTKSNLILKFPNADGNFEHFKIMEAPVLHPDLAAKYPGIKSYVGKGVEDPTAIIRFSLSNEKGLSSMILSGTRNSIFLDPYTTDLKTYITYSKSNTDTRKNTFECLTNDIPYEFKKPVKGNNDKDANDQTLRIFRLAMSGTGEYTTFHGGTKASALAAMNTTMTRVNGVYEIDFAITMVLIANNDDVIYTNGGTDPYSGFGLNAQLQSTLTSVIGEANYDIGHLVHQESNSNGNAGCIGCVCVNNQKGSGYTSHVTPQGDDFDIDYVAHEMGHQFGGNHTHTFSGSEGTGAQMEPGSGSSIMGYAGITGASDVQPHSDDYFHFFNIQQVTNYVSSTSCQTTTALTNAVPTANAGSNYTIPKGTAFILEGAGTDADVGDVLTYCWEQGDVGFSASTSVNASNSSGPNFRSLPPTISPNRYMPKLATVIAGGLTTQWETVSNVARNMNFALTVRDNVAGGGQNKIDQMIVTVDGGSGPFAVTSQTSAITWNEGTTEIITWNVANTTASPVSTANVDIFLSIDGGYTYPYTLATAVPNTGSANIVVPNGAATSSARVMVRGSGNIFYALNTTNFSIVASEFVMSFLPTATNSDVCAPGTATYNFTYNTFLGFNQVTTFSATGNPAGTTVTFNPTTAQNDGTAVTISISGITPAMIGNYSITVTGTAPSPLIVKNSNISLNVYSATFNTMALTSPANGALNVTGPYTFNWVADPNAATYEIDIASDAGFTTIVDNATGLTSNSYTSTALASATMYYWRVMPSNQCGSGTFSTVYSFTTSNCNTIVSTDVGQVSNVASFTSLINVTAPGTVTDVNVLNLDIPITWVGDLSATLTSPLGTTIQLFDGPGIPASTYGCDGDDLYASFDDGATLTSTDFENMCNNAPAISGTFQPIAALSAFNGEVAAGNWTLTIFDSYTTGDDGTLDNWELDLCLAAPNSITHNEVENSISIYPNPTNNNISIDVGDVNIVDNIILLDVQGKIVYKNRNITHSKITIDLNNQSEGIYILKVQQTNKVNTYKVVKQ